MRRKVFDELASAGGALIVIVLALAGALLLVGYNFANSNVHSQLAQQQITFPAQAAFAHPVAGSEITPSMIGTVSKYAGQPLVTGQQAEVYANDFIAVHLKEIGGGLSYAQLSAKATGKCPPGSGGLHRRRSQSPERLPGHHIAGAAPRGLRLRDLRHHCPVGCDRRLRPGYPHGPPGPLRHPARPKGIRGHRDAGPPRARSSGGLRHPPWPQPQVAKTVTSTRSAFVGRVEPRLPSTQTFVGLAVVAFVTHISRCHADPTSDAGESIYNEICLRHRRFVAGGRVRRETSWRLRRILKYSPHPRVQCSRRGVLPTSSSWISTSQPRHVEFDEVVAIRGRADDHQSLPARRPRSSTGRPSQGVIDAEDDLRVVGEAATVGEALDQILSSCPDVAILDVELPDGNGVEVGRDIRSYCPGVKCVMLTGIMDDEALIAAAIAGADGFLSKPTSAASLLNAIRRVASGHQLVEPALVSRVTERLRHGRAEDPLLADLDPHERRVLNLVADGHTNRQQGENHRTHPSTVVKTHISDALAKLGIIRRGFTPV